jgi:hypothetical protein
MTDAFFKSGGSVRLATRRSSGVFTSREKPMGVLSRLKRLVHRHRGDERSRAGLRWIAASDNPYGIEILDCSSITQTLFSTTADESIAKSFVVLRSSVGREYCDQEPEGCRSIECELQYPAIQLPADGPVFKAKEMEDKWDIYLYDFWLYFCRSWTGTLAYRAQIVIQPDRTFVTRIGFAQARHTQPGEAIGVVDFLIKSHLYGAVVPHPIPHDALRDAHKLAIYSFAQYGRRGLYATYGDSTGVRVRQDEGSTDPNRHEVS